MILKEITNDEFDNFSVNYNTKSIYQKSSYALVMNNQGFNSMLLGLFDNDKIVAATLLLIRKHEGFKIAFAPRGFLIDYNDSELLKTFTESIKKYLEKLNIVSIRLAPILIKDTLDKDGNVINHNQNYEKIMSDLKELGYRHLGYNNNFEALKPRFDAVLDIDKNYIQLFNNIKKEFRTKIRSADKNGIKVYKGGILDIPILYNQIKQKYPRDLKYLEDAFKYYEHANMAEIYYTKLDTTMFLKLYQHLFANQESICEELNMKVLNPKTVNSHEVITKKMSADKKLEKYKKQLVYATRLLKNYPEGIITSSAMILKNVDEIFLFMDGYDITYKNLNSKHLLIWKLIEKFSKLGYKKFNFGGITNVKNTLSKYNGLNEFKLSFNSNIIEYAGDFELVTNNKLYFMYKNKGALKNILKK